MLLARTKAVLQPIRYFLIRGPFLSLLYQYVLSPSISSKLDYNYKSTINDIFVLL